MVQINENPEEYDELGDKKIDPQFEESQEGDLGAYEGAFPSEDPTKTPDINIAGKDSRGKQMFNDLADWATKKGAKTAGGGQVDPKGDKSSNQKGAGDKLGQASEKLNETKDLARGLEGGARVLAGDVDPEAIADLVAGLKVAAKEGLKNAKKNLKTFGYISGTVFVLIMTLIFAGTMALSPLTKKAEAQTLDQQVFPKICIDPGHPSSTTGAPGEKELNFKMATQLKAALEAKGYPIFMTKNSVDEKVDNKERAYRCSANGGEFMYSLHADGSGNDTDFPYHIYANNKRDIYEESKSSADEIQKILYDTLNSAGMIGTEIKGKGNCEENVCTGATDLGVFVGGDEKSLPVVIIEMIHLKPDGSSWLDNDTNRAKFIEGLVNGIMGAYPPEDNPSASTGTAMTKVPYYKQGDPRWGGKPYGSCGDGSTIATSGCGVTSLAMVISYWTGNNVYPDETAKKSVDNGWRVCGQGTSWAAMTEMPKMYGLKSKTIGKDWDAIKKELQAGNTVIQSHGPGHFTRGGHFIVLTGISGSTVYVNDPNGRHEHYQKGVPESWILDSMKNSWVVTK